MSRRKKNGIPDRWLDYTAVGKRLPGTRFVAFKVPLKQSLNSSLSDLDVFGPWELLDALSEQNQALGLIIDLTFTTRYYSLQDIPWSLLCVKIFTAGHDVPSDETILSFKRAVRNFLRDNEDNDKLIGVHCTHGLNRTGYLICRYLIDVEGMDPEDAVQLFNSSRGHAIERQNYLEDLRHGPKRSNDGMEKVEQEPKRGEAIHRWSFTSSKHGHRNDGQLHHSAIRSAPPQGPSHQLRPPNSILPTRPLHPFPYFHPPTAAPFRPFRWDPAQTGSQWRMPPFLEEEQERRFRHPRGQHHTCWTLEDRRRAVPASVLPPYSPHWASNSNSCEITGKEWTSTRMRSKYPPKSH
ncbi:RNA/RNP complex-1-interacting phosphatase [Pholidichthys leucotaenia]